MKFRNSRKTEPVEPREQPSPPLRAVSPERKEDLTPWRWMESILVIEDDLDLFELLITELRRDGYNVFAFTRGDDALTWLWSVALDRNAISEPCAILCDVRIARVAGTELFESLRRIGEGVPLILISDSADEWSRPQAMRLEAHCVLEKPFTPEVLRAAVIDVVEAKDYFE